MKSKPIVCANVLHGGKKKKFYCGPHARQMENNSVAALTAGLLEPGRQDWDSFIYIQVGWQGQTTTSHHTDETLGCFTHVVVPFNVFSGRKTRGEHAITSSSFQWHIQGAVSIRKTVLPGMANPMLKIRRPNGRLIFNMEITIRR